MVCGRPRLTSPSWPPWVWPESTRSPSPLKPAWQMAIDRALIRAGHLVEAEAKRLRAAPQNTQIIVVIVVGTVTILAIGLVLFLALH